MPPTDKPSWEIVMQANAGLGGRNVRVHVIAPPGLAVTSIKTVLDHAGMVAEGLVDRLRERDARD